jgi:uncharacterized membrane protein YebE (DUF533 family)
MDAVNTLRAVLAGGALVAALVAAATGMWLTTAILAVGLVAHGYLWVRMHRAAPPAAPSPPPAELR